MTVVPLAAQIVGLIVGAAALFGALAYLIRLGRRAVRFVGKGVDLLRALHSVVNHELTPNHGTSIKDDVYGIAVAVGLLSRDFEEFKHDFYRHLAEKEPMTE